ncbi:phosphoribosylformylglycinamidine cyclo-ligase [Candidatus Bathyarchaeota archaeon]|nr:phosphoribosylformylglycinamidine cyclo-ligase [Candidatus Bathyarchaeota archaeon]
MRSKDKVGGYTYADSGVDRDLRLKSKGALRLLDPTLGFSRYGSIVQLPYGRLLPFRDGWLDLVIEGVGTKVLLAQLAGKFDTIGVDGVAMAVNDVIRSGAKPLCLVNNIHIQRSDPILVSEILKGLAEGASEAGCPVVGGEIGDVAEIIRGVAKDKGFDLVVACIGEVSETGIIRGNGIRPGDGIIGLRSSGIHSNGVTLARKVLLRRWGGVFDAFDTPEGLEKPIIYEMLEPTKIYVKPVLSLLKEFKVKAVVHITGDAYLKFEKLMALNPGVGFEFTNFKPQPIFNLIQEASRRSRGPISDSEMLRTFNMGWGLALVVDSELMDGCLDLLNREGGDAEAIGHVDDTGHISAFFKGRRLILR